MQPKIKLSCHWKHQHQDIKEAIAAVTRAVAAGHRTKDKLLAALPQFSTYRIALAIDALMTADMAQNNLGALTIHPDMGIVLDKLLNNQFEFPLSAEEAKANGVRRELINRLGCKNPAGVQALLSIKTTEA